MPCLAWFPEDSPTAPSALRRVAERWRGDATHLLVSGDRISVSLYAGKRLAQGVKAHGAQAECLGVKVLEAEGCSGPCHGILPGL